MKTLQDHLISAQQANQLQEEYNKKNYVFINDHRDPKAPDALRAIYDLEIIQDYLNYVRVEAQKKGVTNVKLSINFGQYPLENFDSRLDPNFKGYQTVLISPENDALTDLDSLDFGNMCPPY